MARRTTVKPAVETTVETNAAPVETNEATVETTVSTNAAQVEQELERIFTLLTSLENFTKAKAAPAKTNKLGIGKFIQELMITNPTLGNKDLLTAALAQFPTAQTSSACIAWYRSDLRKKGLIPTK